MHKTQTQEMILEILFFKISQESMPSDFPSRTDSRSSPPKFLNPYAYGEQRFIPWGI